MILDSAIKPLLNVWSIKVLPKSPIGKAVGYALGQWAALNSYLEEGYLSIDNNLSERALRHVVIGRKNWLFAGSAVITRCYVARSTSCARGKETALSQSRRSILSQWKRIY